MPFAFLTFTVAHRKREKMAIWDIWRTESCRNSLESVDRYTTNARQYVQRCWRLLQQQNTCQSPVWFLCGTRSLIGRQLLGQQSCFMNHVASLQLNSHAISCFNALRLLGYVCASSAYQSTWFSCTKDPALHPCKLNCKQMYAQKITVPQKWHFCEHCRVIKSNIPGKFRSFCASNTECTR